YLGTIKAGSFPTTDKNMTTSNLTYTWKQVGAGLSNIPIRGLFLNQIANTLSIATYGRGEYQIWLNSSAPNVGAMRVISGSAIWTGPVSLAGPTVISADGTASLQAGGQAPQLNIVGPISDLTVGANNYLTIGNAVSEQGTVTFSGKNTYGGTTEV